MEGHTLITTDGITLLGADDKAGIAEIMTAAEEVLEERPETTEGYEGFYHLMSLPGSVEKEEIEIYRPGLFFVAGQSFDEINQIGRSGLRDSGTGAYHFLIIMADVFFDDSFLSVCRHHFFK